MISNRYLFITLTMILFLTLALSACGPATTPALIQPAIMSTPIPSTQTNIPAPTSPSNPNLILATTTSTQDSGLLDELIPAFENETGYTVQVVAVGSGAALKMGEEGNADVLLVHSPTAEMKFINNAYGTDRRLVMHN